MHQTKQKEWTSSTETLRLPCSILPGGQTIEVYLHYRTAQLTSMPPVLSQYPCFVLCLSARAQNCMRSCAWTHCVLQCHISGLIAC